MRVSELAPLVGRSDQAQLTWHFRRLVGTTPVATGTADMAKGGTRGVNQSADSCERGE